MTYQRMILWYYQQNYQSVPQSSWYQGWYLISVVTFYVSKRWLFLQPRNVGSRIIIMVHLDISLRMYFSKGLVIIASKQGE